MGYDFDRIIGENKEYLKCPICFDVVKDVVQIVCCQQFFCKKCLDDWLSHNSNQNIGNCPFDRSRITRRKIVKVPRIVGQILEGLSIKCQYQKNGCKTNCKLSELETHEKSCEFRDGFLILCECGLWITRQDISYHTCIRFLSQKIEFQDKRISQLQTEIRKMKSGISSSRLPLLASRRRKRANKRQSEEAVKRFRQSKRRSKS